MEGKTDSGNPVKYSGHIRRALKALIARQTRKKVLDPVPWAQVRERKGSRTLFWGSGDGKTFGSVPLAPEVTFSVEANGVKLRNADGTTCLIGSPGIGTTNHLLSRNIEKALRNQGRRNTIIWASIVTIVFLVVLEGLGGTNFEHLARITPADSGSGSLSSFSGLPVGEPSMSSGLTCHMH